MSSSDGGGHFDISSILAKRKNAGGLVEYKISWMGFGSHEDTWELRKSLIEDGHRTLISAFEAETRGKTPSKTPRRASTAGTRTRGRSPARGSSRSQSPTPERRGRSRPSASSETEDVEADKPSPKKVQTPVASPAAPAATEEEDVPLPEAGPHAGSYASIAANLSLSTFYTVSMGLFVLSMIVYTVAQVALAKDGQEKSMIQAFYAAKVVSGQMPSFLCCLVLYRKDWGASFDFGRFLCIGMVWLWADAVISELQASAEGSSQETINLMSSMCCMMAHLALLIAFNRGDDDKGSVSHSPSIFVPYAAATGAFIAYLMNEKVIDMEGDCKMYVLTIVYIILMGLSGWKVACRVGYGMRGVNTVGAVPQWVAVVGSLSLTISEGLRRFGSTPRSVDEDMVVALIVKGTNILALVCFTSSMVMSQSRLLELKSSD